MPSRIDTNWYENCALVDMTVDADADLPIVAPSGVTFKITEENDTNF